MRELPFFSTLAIPQSLIRASLTRVSVSMARCCDTSLAFGALVEAD